MKTWAEDVFRQTDALPAEPLATPVTVRLDTLSALFRLAWWAGGSGGQSRLCAWNCRRKKRSRSTGNGL